MKILPQTKMQRQTIACFSHCMPHHAQSALTRKLVGVLLAFSPLLSPPRTCFHILPGRETNGEGGRVGQREYRSVQKRVYAYTTPWHAHVENCVSSECVVTCTISRYRSTSAVRNSFLCAISAAFSDKIFSLLSAYTMTKGRVIRVGVFCKSAGVGAARQTKGDKEKTQVSTHSHLQQAASIALGN